MLKLFKRKRTVLLSTHPIVSKAVSLISKHARDFAKWLQEQTKTWSKWEWQILLFIFCTVVFLVCGQIIRGSLKEPVIILIPEVRIRPLQHYRPEEMKSNSIIILDNLTRYKKFLDSLRTHDRIQYSLITSANPGLIDSLNQLIDLYQTQIK
ncbi:hypothetical protein [Pinibacter aurantiacus]|uniref:Uncharacterized protein n=1 Tax=Pinibacter aurantiacus TaxID=2851599 RepID=A0A9E2S807_9BACT|nr:hypothetical protein [Pinibacter aurantiacus]MBV4357312.1 hypothetical protein [Pinibacter aurantiacus]